MFPGIARVAADLLARRNVVTPVDVLMGMGLLRPEHPRTGGSAACRTLSA